MYDFEFHRPKTLSEAADLLAKHREYKLLAGGMSLIPTLKLRLAHYEGLVDLGALSDLRAIRRDGDTLVIGSMATHAAVAASAEVRRAIPALADLAEGIGDPLVRNRGTVGGSIAYADPAADYPAAVVGLGGTVVTNRRRIAGDDFFTGMLDTALQPGEIITEVRFPVPRKAAYVKHRQQASRFALVGVFVAQGADQVRVAVTGAGPSVFRVKEAEAALTKRFDAAALDGIAIKADGLNTDIHASAEYRAYAVGVLARRAVAAAR
jgi:carbon-monoxide dehydrogenase medium subunit